MHKDVKRLVRLATRAGWESEAAGSGHVRFISPEGAKVIGSLTPSKQWGVKKLIKDLRKAGLDV